MFLPAGFFSFGSSFLGVFGICDFTANFIIEFSCTVYGLFIDSFSYFVFKFFEGPEGDLRCIPPF